MISWIAVILYVLVGLFSCGVYMAGDEAKHELTWWIYLIGFLFWPAIWAITLGRICVEVAKEARD